MSPITVSIILIGFSFITGGILLWNLISRNESEHKE